MTRNDRIFLVFTPNISLKWFKTGLYAQDDDEIVAV